MGKWEGSGWNEGKQGLYVHWQRMDRLRALKKEIAGKIVIFLEEFVVNVKLINHAQNLFITNFFRFPPMKLLCCSIPLIRRVLRVIGIFSLRPKFFTVKICFSFSPRFSASYFPVIFLSDLNYLSYSS